MQRAVPFADPFIVRVEAGETAAAVRARARQQLAIPEADFEAWKLVLCP